MAVGLHEVKFIVHPDVITQRSKFFKSACSPAWGDNTEPVKLPDTTPQIFSNYLRVLYRSSVPPPGGNGLYNDLARIYILADELGDLQSANMVMDELIKSCEKDSKCPGPSCVNLIIKSTPDNSPLRRLIVDYYTHEFNEAVKLDDRFSTIFLIAVVNECMRLRLQRQPCIFAMRRPKCYYHQHDESFPECETGVVDDRK